MMARLFEGMGFPSNALLVLAPVILSALRSHCLEFSFRKLADSLKVLDSRGYFHVFCQCFYFFDVVLVSVLTFVLV